MLNRKFPCRSNVVGPSCFWAEAEQSTFDSLNCFNVPTFVFVIFFSPASTQSMKFINSSIPNQWERERRIPTTNLRWGLIYNVNFDVHIKISQTVIHYISTTALLQLFLCRIKYSRQINSQMLIIALQVIKSDGISCLLFLCHISVNFRMLKSSR